MDLQTLVDLVTTIALIAGFLFAAVEWRRARREARRQAQLLLLRSFDSPEFVRAMRLVIDLPPGLSKEELEARVGPEGTDLVWFWLGIQESLGLLAFERQIDIRDVDRAFGGPVIQSFAKLERYILDIRVASGRQSMHEWFHWLAEHLVQLEHDEGRLPAHLKERDWRP